MTSICTRSADERYTPMAPSRSITLSPSLLSGPSSRTPTISQIVSGSTALVGFSHTHNQRLIVSGSTVLTSGFSEANTESGANPIRQCALESEYDYETDSDLDEFEEVYSPRAVASSSSSATSATKGKSKDEGPGADEPPKISPGSSELESSVKQRQILLPSIAHRT